VHSVTQQQRKSRDFIVPLQIAASAVYAQKGKNGQQKYHYPNNLIPF
jgi:hypothetical protein